MNHCFDAKETFEVLNVTNCEQLSLTLEEINKIYEERLKKVDEEGKKEPVGEATQLQLKLLREWITHLIQLNYKFCEAVEKLSVAEASCNDTKIEKEETYHLSSPREGVDNSHGLHTLKNMDHINSSRSHEEDTVKKEEDGECIKELRIRLSYTENEVGKLRKTLSDTELKMKRINEDIINSEKCAKEMRAALTAEVAEKHDQVLSLRRDVHGLEEKLRQADMQTHFKDDIIKELRKEIKIANNKLHYFMFSPSVNYSNKNISDVHASSPIKTGFKSKCKSSNSYDHQKQHNHIIGDDKDEDSVKNDDIKSNNKTNESGNCDLKTADRSALQNDSSKVVTDCNNNSNKNISSNHSVNNTTMFSNSGYFSLQPELKTLFVKSLNSDKDCTETSKNTRNASTQKISSHCMYVNDHNKSIYNFEVSTFNKNDNGDHSDNNNSCNKEVNFNKDNYRKVNQNSKTTQIKNIVYKNKWTISN